MDEAVEKYSRAEVVAAKQDTFPDKGVYCPKCKTYVPQFEDLTAEKESLVRDLIRNRKQMQAMALVREITGCNLRWAKIWVLHEGIAGELPPVNPPPLCSYCEAPLNHLELGSALSAVGIGMIRIIPFKEALARLSARCCESSSILLRTRLDLPV